MKKLGMEAVQKIQQYIMSSGRPLEGALITYETGKGDVEAVVHELMKFQNSDGGFGHAIEPDFRLPESSAIATSVAMQIMSRVKLKKDNPAVRRTMDYLKKTFNGSADLWEPVPESISNYPRAVWWNWESADNSEKTWGNPSAELTGYLYEWPYEDLNSIRDVLTAKAFNKLEKRNDTLEMHELLCYLRLAGRLGSRGQNEMYALLDPHVEKLVCDDPEKWEEYNLKPLQVVPDPHSHYHDRFKHILDVNLDFLMDTLKDNGSWDPVWKWGRFESDWEKAKLEWSGIITLDNFRILNAYGRLEKK